jgi:glutamate carboxypeptidase
MSEPDGLLSMFQRGLEDDLELLRRMVELESCSDDKPGIDRLVDFVSGEFQARGAGCSVFQVPSRGNILKAVWKSGSAAKPVMLLGHLDTVWPAGTLRERPFRVEGGRAYGPGIFDMKASILLCLLVCEALARENAPPPADVVFFFTSDEETGTETGLPFLQAEAVKCAAVFCLEPPLPGGRAKTSRKGVGDFSIEVRGIPAHAGLDHEKGANAIVELARHLIQLQALTDYDTGTTVSVGTIRGGTASNVVPARAEASVDFRAATVADARRVEAQVRSIRPIDTRCTIQVNGGLNRPPLERTPAVVELFETAREIARKIGMDLGEGPSGGGSDGSLTAAMGIPTLDGLGVQGDGAHAAGEHILIEDIPRRAALLTHLVKSIAERY